MVEPDFLQSKLVFLLGQQRVSPSGGFSARNFVLSLLP